MVDLVGWYSKQIEQMNRVSRVRGLRPASWPERVGVVYEPIRVDQRLSAEDVQRMVVDYQDGASGRELAERFGIARSTVIGLLREQQVAVRHLRLTAEEVERAVTWYREGVRQIEIAERLGRHKAVVWHLLRRAGEL
jgi:DNA-binding CsgD family transcriptional regulator